MACKSLTDGPTGMESGRRSAGGGRCWWAKRNGVVVGLHFGEFEFLALIFWGGGYY